MQTMIRERSSSRCSTRLSSSSCETDLRRANLGPASGAVVADYLALDRLDGLGLRLSLGALDAQIVVIVVIVLTGHRRAELAHPLAHGASKLGQALGPEDDEGDDQDDD